MQSHDCKVCIHKKLYANERRTCYLYHQFPDGTPGHVEGDSYDIPRFDVDGKIYKGEDHKLAVERRFLNRDDFLEVLWQINEALPHLSAWQILHAYFKEVCPTAFQDPILSALVNAQASCSEYKLDITNDQIRYDVLGFYMTLPDLLEAFDIIVGARGAYERYETERMQKEAEKRRNKG